jgi:hypothetical protein
MTKRLKSSVVILAFVAALFPTPVISSPTHEIIYAVWWDPYCALGPPQPEEVVGEYTRGCENEWFGWGLEPGRQCTYTITSQGEACP